MLSALVTVLFSQCNRTKYICSAYQSSFILDKDYAQEFFAPVKFGEDSLPLITANVKKDKHLIGVKRSRRAIEKSWELVPMITIFPPSLNDSSAIDSTQAVPEADAASNKSNRKERKKRGRKDNQGSEAGLPAEENLGDKSKEPPTPSE